MKHFFPGSEIIKTISDNKVYLVLLNLFSILNFSILFKLICLNLYIKFIYNIYLNALLNNYILSNNFIIKYRFKNAF